MITFLNRAGSVAMTVWLTLALAGVMGLAVISVVSLAQSNGQRNFAEEYRGEAVTLRVHGAPAIQIYSMNGSSTYLDADRQPLSAEEVFPGTGVTLGTGWKRSFSGNYRFWDRVWEIHNLKSSGPNRQRWFRFTNEHGTWLEGFAPRQNQRLGYIGRDGFSKVPLTNSELFPFDLSQIDSQNSHIPREDEYYPNNLPQQADGIRRYLEDRRWPLNSQQMIIGADETLWWIDLPSQKVVKVLDKMPILSIGITSTVEPLAAGGSSRYLGQLQPRLAVRTEKTIEILDFTPALPNQDPTAVKRATFQIPENLRNQSFQIFVISPTRVVLTFNEPGTRPVLASPPEMKTLENRQIVELSSSGEQTGPMSTIALQLQKVYGWNPWIEFNIVGIVIPAPSFTVAVITLMPALSLHGRVPIRDISFTQKLAWNFRLFWPALLINTLLGLFSTWLVARHRARHRLPRSWGWQLFAFTFGLPGLVGYLLHRPWPSSKPVAPPTLTGTEVFV